MQAQATLASATSTHAENMLALERAEAAIKAANAEAAITQSAVAASQAAIITSQKRVAASRGALQQAQSELTFLKQEATSVLTKISPLNPTATQAVLSDSTLLQSREVQLQGLTALGEACQQASNRVALMATVSVSQKVAAPVLARRWSERARQDPTDASLLLRIAMHATYLHRVCKAVADLQCFEASALSDLSLLLGALNSCLVDWPDVSPVYALYTDGRPHRAPALVQAWAIEMLEHVCKSDGPLVKGSFDDAHLSAVETSLQVVIKCRNEHKDADGGGDSRLRDCAETFEMVRVLRAGGFSSVVGQLLGQQVKSLHQARELFRSPQVANAVVPLAKIVSFQAVLGITDPASPRGVVRAGPVELGEVVRLIKIELLLPAELPLAEALEVATKQLGHSGIGSLRDKAAVCAADLGIATGWAPTGAPTAASPDLEPPPPYVVHTASEPVHKSRTADGSK